MRSDEPMTLSAFEDSLGYAEPPPGLSPLLLALWHDARGDWDRAHELAQDVQGVEGAWVHAYLHRKEGDAGNAAYWYHLAGQPVVSGALEAEWRTIVTALLTS